MTPDHATLAARAQHLLDLHRPGDPLVLVNAWDVASAAVIEHAGARAIATSSAAIAASVGEVDDDRMDVDLAFDVIRRIAGATTLPVSADIEAGYGLDAVRGRSTGCSPPVPWAATWRTPTTPCPARSWT